MKFHRESLISNILYSSQLTCPLGANQPFEGLIRLSICCQLCSFSNSPLLLGQVIPVTKLICIQAACNQGLTGTSESIGIRYRLALLTAAAKDANVSHDEVLRKKYTFYLLMRCMKFSIINVQQKDQLFHAGKRVWCCVSVTLSEKLRLCHFVNI